MRYALVKPDGSIERTHDFGTDTPPVIATHKGRWVVDVPPVYNPETHRIVPGAVKGSDVEVPYNVLPLPKGDVDKIKKLKEVRGAADSAKQDAFVAMLVEMQPADLDNYIRANVPDPKVQDMFIKFGRVLLPLAKREFTEL